MRVDIVTIFPESFESYFSSSMIKRAQDSGLVEINLVDLRKYSQDKHNSVDDKPFGGGPGMVMMVQPIHSAVNDLKTPESKVIAVTAKGETYKQSTANKLSEEKHLIILCGHYAGFDQRIYENLVDYKISIGNYVLTGGEIPAMIIVDSVTRLIPGVLGNDTSAESDSFYNDDETIQYPIYTRPAEYDLDGKILKVPDVLLSGDHKKIEEWRKNNSKKINDEKF